MTEDSDIDGAAQRIAAAQDGLLSAWDRAMAILTPAYDEMDAAITSANNRGLGVSCDGGPISAVERPHSFFRRSFCVTKTAFAF